MSEHDLLSGVVVALMVIGPILLFALTGRDGLYTVLLALLMLGVMALLTVTAVHLLPHLDAGATVTVLLGGTVGAAFVLVFPIMGLIYRHDREAFRRMARPGPRAPRTLRPLPPLQAHTLWHGARWLLGLPLLAEGLNLLLRWSQGQAWAPPGLLSLLGLYLAGTLLVGGHLYLRLRGPIG